MMIIDIPAGTDPTSDKMAILLAELLYATGLTEERRQGHFINFHSDDLRKLLGRTYCKIVNEACRLGYVEQNPRYAVGRFSKSFRLARAYRRPKMTQYKLAQRGMLGCSYRLRLRPCDVIGKSLTDHFGVVSLPQRIVERSKGWARFCARSVQHGSLYATRCEYGRLHTTFTGMPSKLRRELRIEGRSVLDIDVANCQPLLVGLMAGTHHNTSNHHTSNHHTSPQQHRPCVVQSSPAGGCSREQSRCGVGVVRRYLPVIGSEANEPVASGMVVGGGVNWRAGAGDVIAFIDLCTSGELYEALLEPCRSRGLTSWSFIPAEFRHPHATNRPLTRKHVKKAFVIMLFCQNDAMLRMPIFDMLAEQFPSVARFIVDAKRENHADLAKACQRFESSLMIDGVAADLVGQIPLLTIHDAIVAKEEDADIVETTIREHFARLGVGVKVNRGD